MSYYAASFTATASSAHYTARLCYRKARLDVARTARTAHTIATHPNTVKTIKLAVWGIYIAAVVTYALGQTARIYAQCWVDAEVSAALPSVNDAVIKPDTINETGAESLITADPFAPEVNPMPMVVAPVPALAEMTVTTEKPMTIRQLKTIARSRKLRGYGDMTKAQLVQALAG